MTYPKMVDFLNWNMSNEASIRITDMYNIHYVKNIYTFQRESLLSYDHIGRWFTSFYLKSKHLFIDNFE